MISDPSSNKRPPMRRRLLAGGALFIVAAGLAFLAMTHRPAAQMGPPAGRPAPENVAVATVGRQDVPVVFTGLGTVTPLTTVTVKSQISGYLTSVNFKEGQMVRKGDVLAEIDPRPYQALLEQYEGTAAKDQALLDNARLDLKRYQTLFQQDSVARQTLDTQAATVREYEGAVRSDRGQVETEKVNLAYCRITAPVDGRVGLRQVDPGNYVGASDSNGIVVVTEIAPISVVFVLPEDKVPAVRARLKTGASLRVEAYDRANAAKLAEGVLATLDNQLDTTTGTLKLRAVFANSDDVLFPNQFVNARLLLDTQKNVVTVPQSALQNGADGRTVYLVDAQNKVHLRTVETGISNAGMVVVTRGLDGGERVVTDGVDRLTDGAIVTVVDAGRS